MAAYVSVIIADGVGMAICVEIRSWATAGDGVVLQVRMQGSGISSTLASGKDERGVGGVDIREHAHHVGCLATVDVFRVAILHYSHAIRQHSKAGGLNEHSKCANVGKSIVYTVIKTEDGQDYLEFSERLCTVWCIPRLAGLV